MEDYWPQEMSKNRCQTVQRDPQELKPQENARIMQENGDKVGRNILSKIKKCDQYSNSSNLMTALFGLSTANIFFYLKTILATLHYITLVTCQIKS